MCRQVTNDAHSAAREDRPRRRRARRTRLARAWLSVPITMLTNGHYSRVRGPRGVERPQRIERTQRILPYEAHNRSLTRRFFDEGDQHEVDQEWEEDVENTRAAEDPERRFSSFDRVPKRHGPRRIAAAAFLLVGAGFLWHYRQGVREVVSSRLFHEPTGGSMNAVSVPARAQSVAAPFASLTPTVDGSDIGSDWRRSTR